MSIAALILAAGSSQRMGRTKALLDYRGRTFLESVIATLRDAAVNYIIVAVRPGTGKILPQLSLPNIVVVENADHETAGPLGSIRSAVSQLINYPVEMMLVWPVDQPHVRVDTINILLRTALNAKPAIAVPVFEGRRGHPVLFNRSVFSELVSAPDDQGARYVVRRLPSRVLEIPVTDPAVLEDIDTPDDYDRLISSTKLLL